MLLYSDIALVSKHDTLSRSRIPLNIRMYFMIRKIEITDIPQCVDVIKSSFQTVADDFGITPENAPSYVAFAVTRKKLIQQYNDKQRILFGYFSDENKLIAFCSLLINDDGQCELNNLCVLKSFRRNGIGKALLEHAVSCAENCGCKRMKIGILEENTSLKLWYESLGFKSTGTEKLPQFPFTCGYMTKELKNRL